MRINIDSMKPGIKKPPILCIAGFDPTGGAGILADARIVASYGFPCAGAITAIANQTHETGIAVFPIPENVFEESLIAALSLNPAAVKIGMLANEKIVGIAAKHLRKLEKLPIISDIVIESSSGMTLLNKEGIEAFESELVPILSLIKPNWSEAEKLSGTKIKTIEDAVVVAKFLNEKYSVPVLLSGGHSNGEPLDILASEEGIVTFGGKRIHKNFRGTGCATTSAIAAEMAQGKGLTEAIKSAKEFLFNAMQNSKPPYITFDKE